MRRTMLLAAVLLLVSALSSPAGATTDVRLVKDIRPGGRGSGVSDITTIGDRAFFFAYDGHDAGLWGSDGTRNGTVFVRDVFHEYESMVVVDDTLYFVGSDGTHGTELWKSDGTEAGTAMVKDIRPGEYGSYPGPLTALGELLIFGADDGVHGYEVWRSDGTETGTYVLRDVRPGSDPDYYVHAIVASGDLAYFVEDDGVHGTELWRTDGTSAGTAMVKDLSPGAGSAYAYGLTDVQGTLFYLAWVDECEATNCWSTNYLCTSDGTTPGTVLVRSVSWLPDEDVYWPPYEVAAVGTTFYFVSQDGTHGYELWKSDGTDAGTVMVKDVHRGARGSFPYRLTAVGDTLYFEADDGKHGTELWKSDGTRAGTEMVADIAPGPARSLGEPGESNWYDWFAAIGETLYFTANDGTHGIELWRTDGTKTGTQMMRDLLPGERGSFPTWMVAVGDRLLFSAKSPSTGRELWRAGG